MVRETRSQCLLPACSCRWRSAAETLGVDWMGQSAPESPLCRESRLSLSTRSEAGLGHDLPVAERLLTGSFMRIGDIPQKSSRGARPRYADRGRSGSNNTKQPFGLTGKSLPHSDCCGGIDSS